MKSVSEHLGAVLELLQPLPPLEVVLHDAVGCVLAEDVIAPADLPVADLAGRDGYAVISRDVDGAGPESEVILRVLDDVRAGSTDSHRVVTGAALRISSGAPMPAGADAVVPVEETDGGRATVHVRLGPEEGENVRRQAEDLRAGEIAIAAGQRIGARQIALLAALGRSRVGVHPRPRVVLVSIGDELVEPGRRAGAGQVFDANGHALATAVQDAGGSTFRVAAVPDERSGLRETLEDQLVRADLVITTGGLSYGGNDTVKEVVGQLGSVRFDNVAIWPGRQYGVGVIGGADEGARETPIICLPGDPAATQVGYEVFVRPALLAMAGHSERYRPTVSATVTHAWTSPPGRRQFVPITVLGSPEQGYRATPVGDPRRPLVSALSRANALAVVPESVEEVEVGARLHCLVLES
ncbi:molybdopterin molybdotransferase MoeA [Ruania halotolerans]|uniref:molybdopterin molybdotransferase MoeA n=1 Tax=Ruania halotolerans TaxID=2897773 RepID=UPI001E5AAA03|nr:gephyrin-like molybdotransferase Glp [Ruania halotolerans]UFU07308.1 molybdopterin molybdotransferase MoeA [Ruania halotolerans]